MIDYKRYIHILTAVLITCLMVFVAASCSADVEDVGGNVTGSTEPIVFSAQVASQIATRAGGKYVDEGPIMTGQFCLGYNSTASSDNFRVADVDFDKIGLAGTGLGLVWTADGYKELSWSEIENTSPTTFYMDNVLKEYHKNWKEDHTKGEHDSEIIFKDGHPFVAGLFDYVDGTNDLLWGAKEISRNTNPIVMDLHHNMAIVRVEVTVDKTYQDAKGEIDLSVANVSISNLVHEPYSFNRLDGIVAVADNPTRKTLNMVDTKDNAGSELDWIGFEKGKEETVTDDDNNTTTKTVDIYTTKDFVLPPQGLPEKENRPSLKIETADGRIFTGILPGAMWEEVNGSFSNPMSLYFLKEHILTIRTRITQEPPELTFMPVEVKDWVCKDVHVVTGYQAGLYDATGFYKLVNIYGDRYNEVALSNYGYVNNGSWVFSIFRTITLDYDNIHGKMVKSEDKKDYSFSVNNRYKVYVVKDGKKYSVSGTDLKEILSKDGEWTPTMSPEP